MDDKVRFMRLLTTIQGMEIHLRTKGKMRLTRITTPALLRRIATEFTGKTYPRSTQGMERALVDLKTVKERILAERAAQPVA